MRTAQRELLGPKETELTYDKKMTEEKLALNRRRTEKSLYVLQGKVAGRRSYQGALDTGFPMQKQPEEADNCHPKQCNRTRINGPHFHLLSAEP